VLRFDASRLGSSSDAAANLMLTVRDNDDTRDLVPSNLAFDTSGNLWLIDFGGNLLSRVGRASLSGTGEQSAVSQTTLALSVSALLERLRSTRPAGSGWRSNKTALAVWLPAGSRSVAQQQTPPRQRPSSPARAWATPIAWRFSRLRPGYRCSTTFLEALDGPRRQR
jgi:hypothetical protein